MVGLHERRLPAAGTLRVLAQHRAHPQELRPGLREGLANGLVEPSEANRPVRFRVLRITLVQHDRRRELPLDELLQLRDHAFHELPEGAQGPRLLRRELVMRVARRARRPRHAFHLSAMDGVGEDDGADPLEEGLKVLGGRAPLLEGLTEGLT